MQYVIAFHWLEHGFAVCLMSLSKAVREILNLFYRPIIILLAITFAGIFPKSLRKREMVFPVSELALRMFTRSNCSY